MLQLLLQLLAHKPKRSQLLILAHLLTQSPIQPLNLQTQLLILPKQILIGLNTRLNLDLALVMFLVHLFKRLVARIDDLVQFLVFVKQMFNSSFQLPIHFLGGSEM